MATTQQNTPRGILSGLFGPKFLDDPEAIAGIAGIAQSLGVGSGGASPQPGTSPSPAGPNSPAGQNPVQAGPVSGVVPKSFAEWHADPVNVAKIPAPVSDAPLPTTDQGWHPPMLPPEQLQQQAIQSVPAAAAAAPAPDSSAVPPSGVFPNRTDWLKANPVQVQGAPKPLAGTKKSFLGMALATLGDNIGAALSGGRPMVGSEWMKNVQDIRDYDRNLPVLKQQAENQAYSTALQQEQEKAGITHLQAQTAMLQQSPTPFTKAVGDTRADIENLWKSGSLSEQDFDKQIQLKMGALPPGVARNITPEYLSSVKQLPQQKPIFKVGAGGAIEPLQYRGAIYGLGPTPNEPPEITAAREQARASQQSSMPLDKQEANAWIAAHPGKTLADYTQWKATIVPRFSFGIMNSGTIGNATDVAQRFGMTPVSFDQAAEKYWQTGQLPPSGRGGPSLALNKATMNRAGELHPDGSLAANSAEFKANQESLKKFQSQFDAVTAFENTAEKNINRLLETAKNIPDLGTKFANIPVRSISANLVGTESMARFKADLLTAQNEAAKVLNSANMTGVLSDSARHELQELVNGNLPYSSLSAAFDEIKRDMGNRKQSYQKQIVDIKQRLRSGSGQGSSSPSTKHIIQVGNDRYQYKGTGATDDLSNYDKLPK